jgi:hypothetical protein
VAAEKSQQAIIKDVEDFPKDSLKHTTTEVKNPLPDKEGKFPLSSSLNLRFFFFLFMIDFLNCTVHSFGGKCDARVCLRLTDEFLSKVLLLAFDCLLTVGRMCDH